MTAPEGFLQRDGILLPAAHIESEYVVDPDAVFDNLGDWKVVFCPHCGYSVTFDEAAFESYGGVQFEAMLRWAITHEHEE